MIQITYNVFGNFSRCLLLTLFLLPILGAGTPIHNPSRRVKRLSSPSHNKDTTELAKYVVSLRSRTPSLAFGDNHYCGGVIVSPIFVLTSAHCVMDQRKILHRNRFVVIVAGSPNRLDYKDRNVINMTVKGIFVPVEFTAYNTHNIALIKLTGRLPFDNPNVGIIKLPMAEPEPGLNYTILGWGRMFKNGFMSSNIMSIELKLLTEEACITKLNTFIDEMLCAENEGVDEHACAGDTGGPLIRDNTVYGVVSYRIGCGSKVLPTVFTNVYRHMDWIKEVMIKNGANQLRHFFVIAPIIGFLIGNKILKRFTLYLIAI